ncbi:ABC transporter ATP-binding protein [Nocardioides sp. C4-1]|uniref:energy-coupling factor ABC transporter ATP-binding protein n=1 Tax=Nocardioides sp. C4-1 TaxID=3151851 RepID=UPI0032635574
MGTIELDGAGVEVPGAGDADPPRQLLLPTTLTLSERRIAVIGPNGSGKSTLVRLLNGLVRPSVGRVVVHGVDVGRHPRQARRKVGFCFTDPSAQLVMPTCVEDVELSLRRDERDGTRRRARALAALAEMGLTDQAEQSVHTLSGGQKQLLALAGVLATGPEVLVADEPTTLLDLANSRRVATLLLGLAQQLVLVTHDLDLARRCDRALLVADGAVRLDGEPGEVVEAYVRSVEQDAR